MSEKFVFLSEGKINLIQDKKAAVLNSSIAEGYKQKLKEISAKNEWKRTGTGAKFMGMNLNPLEESELSGEKLSIDGVVRHGNETVVYSLNHGNVGGIYIKDVFHPEEPETYILVKEKMKFYDLDINPRGKKLVASTADSFLERHLTVLDMDSRDFSMLTEGESYDSNPTWSRKDENILYYDSCGLGYDNNQRFIKYGPKSVFCLHTGTGVLVETLVGERYEFYKPFEDSQGNLFYIKRPYDSGQAQGMSFKDVLLIPIKILKAIFGWLNFFTQRYSGESLKTNGNNPAKAYQKSPEQIFIDGNLLEAEKNLKQNQANGEKNPGYAPTTWELIVKKANGEESVLKKGVLDYCVLNDGAILYSNGKYIIKRYETGAEETMVKAHLASKLVDLEDNAL